MAFPVVETTNTGADSSNSSSTTATLPSGIVAGDLLIVFMGYANTNCTVLSWTNGFTQLFDLQQTAGGNNALACGYKKAVGGETTTTVSFTGGNTRSAYTCYRISGAADPATQLPTYDSALGQNEHPDPPNHAPAAGAKDYLWLAAASSSHDATYTVFSTNFTNGIQASTGTVNAGHCVTGSCQRSLNATSQNPTVWTHDEGTVAELVAITMAVHPVAAAPITINGSTASVQFSDVQATVQAPFTLSAATSQLLFSDVQATLDADTVIAGATAQLLLTAVPASIKMSQVIGANTAQLLLTGVQATVTAAIGVTGNTAQLLFTDVQASVTSPFTLTSSTAQLLLTGVQATIGAGIEVTGSTAQLLLSTVQASISATTSIASTAAQLQLAGVQAVVKSVLVVDANTASLLFTGVQASVVIRVVIDANTASLLFEMDTLASIEASTRIDAGTSALLLTTVPAILGGLVLITANTALLYLAADIQGARVGTAIVGTAKVGIGGPITASVDAPTTIPGTTAQLLLAMPQGEIQENPILIVAVTAALTFTAVQAQIISLLFTVDSDTALFISFRDKRLPIRFRDKRVVK